MQCAAMAEAKLVDGEGEVRELDVLALQAVAIVDHIIQVGWGSHAGAFHSSPLCQCDCRLLAGALPNRPVSLLSVAGGRGHAEEAGQ